MISGIISRFFNKRPNNSHVKILVIEDNEVDQKVAVAAIEQGGYASL